MVLLRHAEQYLPRMPVHHALLLLRLVLLQLL